MPAATALTRCPRCSSQLTSNLDGDLECLCGAVVYVTGRPTLVELPPSDPPVVRLTARQLELLHWVAMGATNRLVALNLGIGTGTLKAHIRNIRDRLCLDASRQALVDVAKRLEEA